MKSVSLSGKFQRVVRKRGRQGSKFDAFLAKAFESEIGQGYAEEFAAEEDAKRFLGGARVRLSNLRKQDADWQNIALWIPDTTVPTVVAGRVS